MAERTSESTTTIRTNDVHITSTKGATESVVNAINRSSGAVACRTGLTGEEINRQDALLRAPAAR